jgi:phosphate-selective porin OprO/OprP
MSLRSYLLGSVAACGALAIGAPAMAQSASNVNSQIQALQDQLRAVNQQLQNLQGQVQQTQSSQAQATAKINQISAAPPSGVVVTMPNNRPTFTSADGANTLAITGRLNFDIGAYDYHPGSNASAPQALHSGVNARRARLGVTGKFMNDWAYNLIFDLGGSTDSGANSVVENAYITYNGIAPFHFDLGYQDVPFTLDEATSSNDIMFMERSSSQVIAAGLAAGDNRSAVGARWNTDRAWVGIYGTGPAANTTHGIPQQFGATGRATYQILQDPVYSLHVGVNAEGLIKPATTTNVRTVSTYSDRPELRVDPTSIINTGTIGTATNPVKDSSVLGLEFAGGLGSAFAQAEYFHYNVTRQGLSALNFNGGYVEGSYTLTGESRKYNPATGAYSAITPANPFSWKSGTWGAFEAAARFSVVDLNDLFTPGTTVASTNGVAGGKQTVYTAGLNWYPNSNMRFMLNVLHGDINKKQAVAAVAGSPLGSNVGASFNAVALRSQFNF